MIRRVLALCVLLAASGTALAQEWTDTRVGTYDFVCESLPAGSTSTIGTFISGHQRFSLAARSCAAAAKADPTKQYQVRPATYKITLVAPAPTPTPTPTPAPTFALAFDPTCAALVPVTTTVGVAFVTPSLRTCLSGTEKDSAVPSLVRSTGDDPVTNGVAISADAKVSLPGTKAAGGAVLIRFTAASGVIIEIPRNWAVQP